jgi:hypothetical protein
MTTFQEPANTQDGISPPPLHQGAEPFFLQRAQALRIMFVTNAGKYGGAEKHLVQLLHTFVGSRIELLILCLSEDLYAEHLGSTENLRVDVIHCKTKPDSFLDWYRLFREYRPDVAVFVRASLWCYRWYVPIAACIAGVPRRISIANVGGNAEAIQHGVHGLVVEPGSVDQVAAAISFLGLHPQERAGMSKLARERVREGFDVDVQMAKINRVILN